MLENALYNYGMAGIFILYLIYDRQVLVKGLIKSIDKLTLAVSNMGKTYK